MGQFWCCCRTSVSTQTGTSCGHPIVGSAAEAVEELQKFEALGVEHLVFDFRFTFDRWFDQIELLGHEVLPKMRPREPTQRPRV
jgi:hypothetical protein